MTHVSSMFISEKDPHKVLFTGKDRANFHTLDMGTTYTACPSIEIQDVRLHPTQPDWILASSMSPGCHATEAGPSGEDCFKILYVSKDFGLTWQSILNYVVQFDWALPVAAEHAAAAAARGTPVAGDSLIYVTAHEHQKGSQRFGVWDKLIHFYSSADFFHSKTLLVPHGNRFLFGDYSYLFVAAVDPAEEAQVSLKISRDNTTHLAFHTAMLPGNIHLTEHSYTILDTSEGAVFLHVNHLPFAENAYAGHVYTSDWSGLAYSLSLPYNHRSAEGKCDFEKVEGLEGIYLANFIDEELMEDEEEKEERGLEGSADSGHHIAHANRANTHLPKRERLRTKTVITFDKGGEWSYLVPPTHDSLGAAIQCTGECHLHLHGVTDAYGPFYSAASATGLIMGTGSIGSYLQQHPSEVNTYLSRDAGLTWIEVAKGSHIYEFGNHGALIAMAPDNAATDSLLYSFDEGVTWISHRISEHAFQIENIIIEPEANSHQFLIYGYRENVGVVVHVDFEGLHERECIGHDQPDAHDSDYEKWSPSDRRLNGKCLMGRTVTYIRRKREAQCYVPEAFERPVAAQNCACTASDFECDYGYERRKIEFEHSGGAGGAPTAQQESNAECIPSPSPPPHVNPFDATPPCTRESTYRITKGYRRVPGDSCFGGGDWDASVAQCPVSFGSHVGKMLLVLLILLAVSMLLVLIGSKAEPGTPLAGYLSKFKAYFQTAKYKLVSSTGAGGLPAPHSMVEDEAFYLSEDDMGPGPSLLDRDGHEAGGDAHKRHGASPTGSIGIKPLAASTKAKSSVPTLQPPSS